MQSKKICNREEFPDEVVRHILPYLGVKDLLNFVQVTKKFQEIVENDKALWQKINLPKNQEPGPLALKGGNESNHEKEGHSTKRQVKKRKFYADEY